MANGSPVRMIGRWGKLSADERERAVSRGVDKIFDQSAGETGGSRHIRFVTTPQCNVDVSEVQLPAGSLKSFTGSVKALTKRYKAAAAMKKADEEAQRKLPPGQQLPAELAWL